METKDVFISHAYEDKEEYVYPLVEKFRDNVISYWLDEIEIGWGERIVSKINEGLISSKYVLVVLTRTFLEKKWTNVELENALTTEVNTGRIVVLPVMAISEKDAFKKFPLLNSKLYLRWELGAETIALHLTKLLKREFKEEWTIHNPASYSGKIWVQVLKKPSNLNIAHRYSVRWGPWKYEGTINPSVHNSVTLVHSKGDDGFSIPIFFNVSPPCYISFGQGEPPSDNPVDINHGWIKVQ